MPNYYLLVLYKHIIQVENKNLGLKVGGHKHTIAPPVKKVGGTCPPCPPPASYASVIEWNQNGPNIYISGNYKPPKTASEGVITPNQIPLTTIVTYLQKRYRSRISNHWATIPACCVVPPIYKKSMKTYCHISFQRLT